MTVEFHRRFLIGGYLVLGLYAFVISLFSYEEVLNVQLAVFDHDRLFAYLSFLLIVLTPVSCFFIAFALQKRYHGAILVVPVIHAAFFLLLYGVLMGIYLSGWYFAKARAGAL